MTGPTIVESKLKTGSLTLGDPGIEFGCQATNVTIASDYSEDGDPVEVLCGSGLAAATTVKKTLKITAIQDFTDPAGFMRYLRDHELEEIVFTWQAAPDAEKVSGVLQARLGDWGGDVGKRLTTAPELPIAPGSLNWLPPEPVDATGAVAGIPGVWTPAGCTTPADLAAVQAAAPPIVATPTSAWSTGQYVPCADSNPVHWDGTAWAAGAA